MTEENSVSEQATPNRNQIAKGLFEHGTVEQVNALYSAFVEAQSEFPEITKDKDGVKYGPKQHKYADLASMLKLLRPALKAHGLGVFWPLSGRGTITIVLSHKGGARLTSSLQFEPHHDPQEVGKQTSYMARYAFQSLMGVAAEDDLDATQHAPSYQSRQRSQQRQQTRPARAAGAHRSTTQQSQSPRQRQQATEWVAPFGRTKGQPLRMLDMAELEWFRGTFERNANDPAKADWRDKNLQDLKIVSAELNRRSGQSQPADPAEGIEQPWADDWNQGPQDEQNDVASLNSAIDGHLRKMGMTVHSAAMYCRRALDGKDRSEATPQELADLELQARADAEQTSDDGGAA